MGLSSQVNRGFDQDVREDLEEDYAHIPVRTFSLLTRDVLLVTPLRYQNYSQGEWLVARRMLC